MLMATRQEILSKRPTSPHLSIYRPQISSSLSIFHRMTGIALYFSLMMLSWWFIFFIFKGECKCMAWIFETMIFMLALKAISFCSIYHLLNGIRHLFWDMGYGFSIKAMNNSGWAVVITSVALTIYLWAIL
jgi:succinate dehydrogenase / fumarate reductase, cytochrome b subunit